MSIPIYRRTTSTLTKRRAKKLDSNDTRMLWAVLNTSWRQHSTKQQLLGLIPPITKTIDVRRTRHTRHCWRSKDELIRDVLLWIPSHGPAKVGRPARTYIQQLCADTRWKTAKERWILETGGERSSGRSVLGARNDDDDDDNSLCL